MKTLLVASSLAMLLSGCSFFGDKTQELTVDVDPADARVLINGKWYDPPVRVFVSPTESISVTASREGYVSCTAKCRSEYSKLGTLDLVGTAFFLLPGIGLFSDGAYQLKNSHLYFQLDKKEDVDRITIRQTIEKQ